MRWLKDIKFYLKYFLTNNVVNHVPSHGIRLFWYRNVVGMKIGRGSQIWLGCRFYGDAIHQIEIGENTTLASHVVLNASAPIIIGDNVQIAHEVCMITADHDLQDPQFPFRCAPIHIQSDSWITTRAIILKGVTISEGAAVTAGAVVAHDVKPYAIVAGNPARQIGNRVKREGKAESTRPPLFC